MANALFVLMCSCTVALILLCVFSYYIVGVHLLLSVTEHYLFVLKSPTIRIADNKEEEEACVSREVR